MPARTAVTDSVWPSLEPVLSRVQKPIQYVGGELNSTLKDWADAEVRWALMYPDAYEVGLPNQGVQILYEVLNERDWILAERTYAVWGDMEALMRERGVSETSSRRNSVAPVESSLPLKRSVTVWPAYFCIGTSQRT